MLHVWMLVFSSSFQIKGICHTVVLCVKDHILDIIRIPFLWNICWIGSGENQNTLQCLSTEICKGFCVLLHARVTWGQLFKISNLDKNYPDLEIPFLAIQDQVIRLTFMPVFQSNIGLDHPDPDTQFLSLPNPDCQCFKGENITQCELPAM